MYEIRVLSNQEFDNVALSDPRYEYVDENNLGFADRLKGIAYVRQTNIHDLNKYLIDHELEELESDSSTHEDPNGIRHKKFFKDLFLPLITGGLVKSEAPKREAAQTTFVEGIGHVPRSQLGGFQQPQFQQPFQQPSYNPIFAPNQSTPQTGATSPLNLFPGQPSSSAVPTSVTGNITSSLAGGLGGVENLTQDELLRRSIQQGGRLAF